MANAIRSNFNTSAQSLAQLLGLDDQVWIADEYVGGAIPFASESASDNVAAAASTVPGYTFLGINNPADLTFNQLLSINEAGTIAGYYGNAAAGHDNKGYTVKPPYGKTSFTPENFPASVQTQVTGINDTGLTVGFEVDAADDSYGFIDNNGIYSIAVDPKAPTIGGVVSEQFLGVNDLGDVAGFYVAASDDNAAFVYDMWTGVFTSVGVVGASSVTATDVNNLGYVSGFFTKSGKTNGFVEDNGKIMTVLTGPAGATNVQALGLNDEGEVVGSFVDSKGHTDGFVYNMTTHKYTTIIVGARTSTVVNGVDDAGQLVGFYDDALGHTDGMLLTPTQQTTSWTAVSINNNADPTFNQLLAINNEGTIAGYFGDGSNNPNKGYTVSAPYAQSNFTSENFPGSVQTQVTGINNSWVTSGFEIDAAGNSLGFIDNNGRFNTAIDPSAIAAGGPINEQFLGLNDIGKAAGFYTTGTGANTTTVGFLYNSNNGAFADYKIEGVTDLTLTDINDSGVISGFFASGTGFLDNNGTITNITGAAGDTNIQVLGLNNEGVAVGSFEDKENVTHGFIYTESSKTFLAYDAPGAVGQTVLNGINDLDQIVGFYMNSSGLTKGLLLNPSA